MTVPSDIELRLVDAPKNKFRLYGLTVCRTLFGELALRIVWGRIGNKRLRERTETFSTEEELEHRRDELLQRRRQHRYIVQEPAKNAWAPTPGRAVERAIVESHGLPLASPAVRALVARWHEATRSLASYIAAEPREALDLVDVSTLAAMYAEAAGFA